MKRKILFITFAFMFMLLIFCNNSFASNEIELNGKTYTLPDWFFSKEYRVIVNYQNISFQFACSDSPFTFKVTDGIYYSISNINNTSFYYCQLTSSNGVTSSAISSSSYSTVKQEELMLVSNADKVYYFSSHDIYSGDTLVFQAPVQEIQEITLAQVLEEQKENNPQMVMKEIILILPLILVVVVSYLGLRKALAMLSAILRRS